MRILVVGGTGFIGSFVVRQLRDMGHEVTVFHRGLTVADAPGVNRIVGDRRSLAAFADDFKRLAPDVVLDMILGSEGQAQSLMSTVRGVASRVVVASSIDVYRAYGRVRGFEPGPPDPIPLAEDAPLRKNLRPHSREETRRMNAVSPWFDEDYEKILVERVVMGDPDLPCTVLRLPAVYGPGDPLHRLFPDLRRMDHNRPAILMQENVARWRWSRGYVENVAAAVSLAVNDKRAAGRIYNVAEADALTSAEWVRAIGNAAGWGGEIVALPRDSMPDHLKNSFDMDQHWVVGTTRIRTELGYSETVPLGEGLLRTVGWERLNPPDEVNLQMFDYIAEDEALARWSREKG